MKIFTIIFHDNTLKEFEAESKDALIRDFSLQDATAFQEDVKSIRWEEGDLCYIENIATGKVNAKSAVKDYEAGE